MRIEFSGDFPADIRKEVERHLEPWLWLAPRWCYEIYIKFETNENCEARIGTDIHYRRANLYVSSAWLHGSDADRTNALVHELCHNFFNPLYWCAVDNVGFLLKDNESHLESIKRDMSHHNEGGTCDLAEVLIAKFGGN